MCNWGTTVPMPIGGRVHSIDSCIAHLVAALNAGGIPTVASCCGHGGMPGSVILEDNVVLVRMTRAEFDAYDGTHPTDIHGEPKTIGAGSKEVA